MAEDDVKLRALAKEATSTTPAPWPRREIDREGACDGCAETRQLVAAYDDPDENAEPWLCAECAVEMDYTEATHPSTILALLDRVEAAEAAVERVRSIAERAEETAAYCRSSGNQLDGRLVAAAIHESNATLIWDALRERP